MKYVHGIVVIINKYGLIAVTTDVQYVSLCPVEGQAGHYTIRCELLANTFARGCQYNLVSTAAGTLNVTEDIQRVPFRNKAMKTLALNTEYFSDHQLFAYDWESDGSTGNIPVSRRKTCT